MTEQLESQLSVVREKQDQLEQKLNEVLEGLAMEHQNLKAISTGLVNLIGNKFPKKPDRNGIVFFAKICIPRKHLIFTE